MSYLLSRLPPFAADYSGFASALHDLGGLVVIHDASGCTGSYTGYDEPRWFGGTSAVYCSGLREFDAIMGNDERLLGNIISAYRGNGYRFIAVVGSPVPMLVGFDFDGFANLVGNETGLPAFGYAATGLNLYGEGLSAAFLEMARRFVNDPVCARSKGANILGASPLDNFNAACVAQLSDFLGEAGFPVVSVWGQGSGLDEIARAAEAEVNLVVSAAAMPLARAMKERWGIPYVTGLPLGKLLPERLKQRLFYALGVGTVSQPADRDCHVSGKVLLIGEQVRMNAIRDAILELRPDIQVRVAVFFMWDAELAEAHDRFLANESEALAWVRAENADMLMGDPLLEQLLPRLAVKPVFIGDPHVAVSGRLYRHGVSAYFGSGGVAFLEKALEALRGNG